jgi:hypothetical protein
MNNLLHSGRHGIIMPLLGISATINSVIYKEPIAIGRLLTVDELERINAFNLDNPTARIAIEDDILNNAFKSFLGIAENVDWEETEAGVIDTIINGIVLKSVSYSTDPVGKIEELKTRINVLHQMQAIVSRFLSTPFSEVEQLPINELFRRYTICLLTFPQEVKPISIGNNEPEQDQ